MLLMGKSTISIAVFTSFLYVYQRVRHGKTYPKWDVDHLKPPFSTGFLDFATTMWENTRG